MTPVERFLDEEIAAGSFPGAVALVGSTDGVLEIAAAGHACLEPERVAVARATLFDLASLTKPLCSGALVAVAGGALALGVAAQIGSIEPGKSADLTCIDLDASSCRPATDVAAAIVFGATRTQVSGVWSAGRVAVSEGSLRLFDEAELAAIAARWAERLALEAAA